MLLFCLYICIASAEFWEILGNKLDLVTDEDVDRMTTVAVERIKSNAERFLQMVEKRIYGV